MKKIVTVLVLALITALTIPAGAAEVLPPQLEYIDAQLDVFLPKLEKYQAMYLEKNKGYFQALGSHSLIPTGADGADKLKDHPTDQDTTLVPLWEETGLPTEIAWSFTLSVYDGPKGKGYILTVCTLIDADTWCRSDDFGPEGRTETWAVLGKDE